MNPVLFWYVRCGLISMVIVLLCAMVTGNDAKEGIKVALITGLLWPIVWPLCVYMIIKRRNKK